MKASLAIIGIAIVLAVVYGIVHDQVTARICVEYFTIGHPRVIGSESPTLLALVWGVLATWWAGLILGVLLAVAARAGKKRPKRDVRRVAGAMLVLLATMSVVALLAGVVGWAAADRGVVVLLDPMASRVPADRHVRFLVALWMHSASYGTGFVGGVVLAVVVWRSRGRGLAPGGETTAPV